MIPDRSNLRPLLEQCFLALLKDLHSLVALLLLDIDSTFLVFRICIFVFDDEAFLDE